MDIKLRLVLIIAILLYIFIVLLFVRKNKMALKYSFVWLFCAFLMILGIIFPKLIEFFANTLGFKSFINMIFFLGFFILLFISFSLTIIISTLSRKLRLIIQELSILKNEIGVKK